MPQTQDALTTQPAKPGAIGQKTPRIDGQLKVSGTAQYTSDFSFPGMLYAVPVEATIAKGTLDKLDTSAAEKMPGVVAVYHRANQGKLFRSVKGPDFSGMIDEKRPPLEDDVIRYYGQYVALVVARTFECATAAAHAVKASYSAKKPNIEAVKTADEKPEVKSERGDAVKAFAEAPVQVDATYVTPVETHNPIELHATVALFDGTNFTLYETSQAVVNHRGVMSQMLGVPVENVRVISKFLGSGFGGKLWPWTHSLLAAAAARNLGKPIKLVITRKMMFQTVGHRPATSQRVRLGATPDGKLLSLQHDYVNHVSILDDYSENCGEATPFQYSVENLRVTSGHTRRNVGSPTSMRGPGAVPGLFATESAIDELAIKLKMDPLALHLKIEPKIDEGEKLPFSSRHLVECFQTGAEKFGWKERNPQIGSMRRDGLILGWGIAGCSWLAARFSASASLELLDDGAVRVNTATQDIGTGTYTILAQLAADKLGLPIGRVSVALGDTKLPPGAISGGSMATASCVPAVAEASKKAIEKIISVAIKLPESRFAKDKPQDLKFSEGRVHRKDEKPSAGMAFDEILRKANVKAVTGEGEGKGSFGTKAKVSTHSFGAHFVEVTWQPEIARLRVNRVVTVIDAGRILNPLAGRNQIEGAVVMGVGMGLFEETTYDPRTGAPLNSNLADYIVATNPDAPKHEVHFLDYPDFEINEQGARGIGEIGLAGFAAAVCNAVHHATGVRVRELPIRIEKLLAQS